jgi:hypothetical protein
MNAHPIRHGKVLANWRFAVPKQRRILSVKPSKSFYVIDPKLQQENRAEMQGFGFWNPELDTAKVRQECDFGVDL